MAVLFPALKALGEGYAEKLFYLTARTTGRVAAMDALEMMRAKGMTARVLTITAKGKACPHAYEKIPCHPSFCARARLL